MISYEGLEKVLKEKGVGKTELSTALGLSTRTIVKIGKGERLSKQSIRKIADYLGESTAAGYVGDTTLIIQVDLWREMPCIPISCQMMELSILCLM